MPLSVKSPGKDFVGADLGWARGDSGVCIHWSIASLYLSRRRRCARSGSQWFDLDRTVEGIRPGHT